MRKKILVLILVLLIGFVLGRMTYSPYSFGEVDWENTEAYTDPDITIFPND